MGWRTAACPSWDHQDVLPRQTHRLRLGRLWAPHELASSEGLWGQKGLVGAHRPLGSVQTCGERQQGECLTAPCDHGQVRPLLARDVLGYLVRGCTRFNGYLSPSCGVLPPVGVGGAPFGSSKIGSKDKLLRHRAVESKHGRVTLWACLDDFRPRHVARRLRVALRGIRFTDVRTEWSQG